MSKQLLLPVQITSISTKVDLSVKVTMETRELSAKDAAELFSLRGTEAWAVLAPTEITEVDLPKEKADPSIGTKTPGQRLRGVLFRLWQQSGGGTDFESFYRIKMESIIDQLKAKLE